MVDGPPPGYSGGSILKQPDVPIPVEVFKGGGQAGGNGNGNIDLSKEAALSEAKAKAAQEAARPEQAARDDDEEAAAQQEAAEAENARKLVSSIDTELTSAVKTDAKGRKYVTFETYKTPKTGSSDALKEFREAQASRGLGVQSETVKLASGHRVRRIPEDIDKEAQLMDDIKNLRFTPDEQIFFDSYLKFKHPFIRRYISGTEGNRDRFYKFWKTFIVYDGTDSFNLLTYKEGKEIQNFLKEVLGAYREYLMSNVLQFLLATESPGDLHNEIYPPPPESFELIKIEMSAPTDEELFKKIEEVSQEKRDEIVKKRQQEIRENQEKIESRFSAAILSILNAYTDVLEKDQEVANWLDKYIAVMRAKGEPSDKTATLQLESVNLLKKEFLEYNIGTILSTFAYRTDIMITENTAVDSFILTNPPLKKIQDFVIKVLDIYKKSMSDPIFVKEAQQVMNQLKTMGTIPGEIDIYEPSVIEKLEEKIRDPDNQTAEKFINLLRLRNFVEVDGVLQGAKFVETADMPATVEIRQDTGPAVELDEGPGVRTELQKIIRHGISERLAGKTNPKLKIMSVVKYLSGALINKGIYAASVKNAKGPILIYPTHKIEYPYDKILNYPFHTDTGKITEFLRLLIQTDLSRFNEPERRKFRGMFINILGPETIKSLDAYIKSLPPPPEGAALAAVARAPDTRFLRDTIARAAAAQPSAEAQNPISAGRAQSVLAARASAAPPVAKAQAAPPAKPQKGGRSQEGQAPRGTPPRGRSRGSKSKKKAPKKNTRRMTRKKT